MTSNNERRPSTNKNSKGLIRFMGSAGSGSRGSHFNSSVSTIPAQIQKLSDYKNPQKENFLFWVNRKATTIPEISSFKNLTELDLSWNTLQQEGLRELKKLLFLKNLNLSHNKLTELEELPHRVEILNVSNNQIRQISLEVCKSMRKVTTLDISNNKLESL